MYVSDASYYFDKFIVGNQLTSVYGEHRGLDLLRNLVSEYTCIPIVIEAGFILSGDYDRYYDSESFEQIFGLAR